MQAFREAIESGDFEGAVALMADDVEFRSPVVFKPYRGRDEVRAILLAAFRVFEDFRYVRVMASADGSDHALVFKARALVGYDAARGDELWRFDWVTDYKVNAATPLAYSYPVAVPTVLTSDAAAANAEQTAETPQPRIANPAAALLAAIVVASAQSAFPFDRELLLAARPLPGSKRVPILEIGADGHAQIDLWCRSGAGQAGKVHEVGSRIAYRPAGRSGRSGRGRLSCDQGCEGQS